jgi:hypothetical protein
MSARYPAWIHIGGRLSKADAKAFWDVVNDETLYDDDEAIVERDSFEKPYPGRPISWHHYEARWGAFEALENMLVELKLPYVRWSEDGILVRFDGEQTTSHTCLPDGDVVITQADLQRFDSYEAALAYLREANHDAPPFTSE